MAARRIGILAVASLLVAACAVPLAVVEPVEGRLPVLGPEPGFSSDDLPADWLIEGAARRSRQIVVVAKDGIPALRLVSGSDEFTLARRTRARLLLTPYLSWAWNMEAWHGDRHPVRLVVGFYGGDPQSRSWGSEALRWLGSALPPHDRRLFIVWDRSALKRGSFDERLEDEPSPARYTQRGGRENTGTWWMETVDLADLYARAWPGDDQSRVGIVFIGLAAAAGEPPATAYMSGILLSR